MRDLVKLIPKLEKSENQWKTKNKKWAKKIAWSFISFSKAIHETGGQMAPTSINEAQEGRAHMSVIAKA